MSQIPPEVFKSIAAFLDAEKSGKITLNVRCGQIEQWELAESFNRRSQRRGWVDSGGSVGMLEPTNGGPHA